jgi:hypothetical protein
VSADPKEYFEEDDGQGRVLKVYGRGDGKAALLITDTNGSAMVLGSWVADPLKAPALCRAIFEAAGQVPPDDDDGEFELAAILAAHPDATFPELARAVLADGRFGRRGARGG